MGQRTTAQQYDTMSHGGYGNQLLIDDANVPSLLAMAYLGDVDIKDPIYQNTRRFVWSENNPYFFRGRACEGIGGPVDCRYFTTTLYDLSHSAQIDQRRLDSFVILMGLSGELSVGTDSDNTTLHAFQTLLMPAANGHIEVAGEGRFQEIHIG